MKSNRPRHLFRFALGGSLALGIWATAAVSRAANPPRQVAQTNPNPSIFNEPPFNRIPRQAPAAAPATPDTAQPEQPPVASLTLVDGKFNIRFVNETGAAIEYQVIGQTEYRTLGGRSEISLQDLTTPTTFTFRRKDSGFLDVSLQSTAGNTVTMLVRETSDFRADRTSLYVDRQGRVFLN